MNVAWQAERAFDGKHERGRWEIFVGPGRSDAGLGAVQTSDTRKALHVCLRFAAESTSDRPANQYMLLLDDTTRSDYTIEMYVYGLRVNVTIALRNTIKPSDPHYYGRQRGHPT